MVIALCVILFSYYFRRMTFLSEGCSYCVSAVSWAYVTEIEVLGIWLIVKRVLRSFWFIH